MGRQTAAIGLPPAQRAQYERVNVPGWGDDADNERANDSDTVICAPEPPERDPKGKRKAKKAALERIRARSPNNSDELQAAFEAIDPYNTAFGGSVLDMMKAMPSGLKSAERNLKKCWRVKDLAQVKKRLPRIPDSDNWDGEDRRKVEAEWGEYPQRNAVLSGITGPGKFVLLYKIALKFWKCLPDDIISCDYSLQYLDRGASIPSLRGRPTTDSWAPLFCNTLAKLLAHDMWMRRPEQLATAIQYTIIAMTDDRRPWRMDKTLNYDQFTLELQAASREEGKLPIEERRTLLGIRRALVKQHHAEGRGWVAHGQWNLLFRAIDIIAKQYKKASLDRPNEWMDPKYPYYVNETHLHVLVEALDTMGGMGFPAYIPVQVLHHAINNERDPQKYPRVKDLPALREYAILREWEKADLVKKLAKRAAKSAVVHFDDNNDNNNDNGIFRDPHDHRLRESLSAVDWDLDELFGPPFIPPEDRRNFQPPPQPLVAPPQPAVAPPKSPALSPPIKGEPESPPPPQPSHPMPDPPPRRGGHRGRGRSRRGGFDQTRGGYGPDHGFQHQGRGFGYGYRGGNARYRGSGRDYIYGYERRDPGPQYQGRDGGYDPDRRGSNAGYYHGRERSPRRRSPEGGEYLRRSQSPQYRSREGPRYPQQEIRDQSRSRSPRARRDRGGDYSRGGPSRYRGR
ncbi:hypothetical protein B0T25DRAFT_563718 [Lasiosphaeria hispida]|uniref:Uncharacterized protein n=1 Tax=Lasiosphaeria hispida TaxID=260671 RepID=A0AAJ0HXX1_9PEZI|nr:hypothetical protein B0T25DRAFT_563718 [Lasiosphaeria hispida]